MGKTLKINHLLALQELSHCWVPRRHHPWSKSGVQWLGILSSCSSFHSTLTLWSLCETAEKLDLGTVIVMLVQFLLHKVLKVEKCYVLFGITRSIPASVQGNKNHVPSPTTGADSSGARWLAGQISTNLPQMLSHRAPLFTLFPFCKTLLKKKKKVSYLKENRVYIIHQGHTTGLYDLQIL